MKTIVLVSLLLSLVFTIADAPGVPGWRGIVPLHSTRADVERLLGTGTDSCKCAYYLEDVNAFFYYSSGNCKSRVSGGWDVPTDTVVRIVVYPKRKLSLADLNIDQSKFEKKREVESIVSCWNQEEGLYIEVSAYTDLVMGFYYGPAARDKYLRCP